MLWAVAYFVECNNVCMRTVSYSVGGDGMEGRYIKIKNKNPLLYCTVLYLCLYRSCQCNTVFEPVYLFSSVHTYIQQHSSWPDHFSPYQFGLYRTALVQESV